MSQPSEPSEWAVKAALELLIRWPWARSHLVRLCDTERAIALALDAARVEGVRLGLEAAARVCLALGAGKLDPAKGAAFAAWKKMIAEECTLVVLALDPAAVAKGGDRE